MFIADGARISQYGNDRKNARDRGNNQKQSRKVKKKYFHTMRSP